jgi:hypothetical protein
LRGSSIGQRLLKAGAVADVVSPVPCRAPKAAELGFRLDHGASATIGRITAPQRRWREFRMAQSSRERDAATLPKIWTLS